MNGTEDIRSEDRKAGDDAIARAGELIPGTISRHTLRLGQRVAAQEIEAAIEKAVHIADDAAYREQAEKILAEAQKLEGMDLTSSAVSGAYEKSKGVLSSAWDEAKSQVLARPITIAIIVAGLAGLYVATRKDSDGRDDE